MRDDYLKAAQQVIPDPYILVNVVSRRVKQLRQGSRPLVESLEKLDLEDVAFREISEGKISYELGEPDAPQAPHRSRQGGSPGSRPRQSVELRAVAE